MPAHSSALTRALKWASWYVKDNPTVDLPMMNIGIISVSNRQPKRLLLTVVNFPIITVEVIE